MSINLKYKTSIIDEWKTISISPINSDISDFIEKNKAVLTAIDLSDTDLKIINTLPYNDIEFQKIRELISQTEKIILNNDKIIRELFYLYSSQFQYENDIKLDTLNFKVDNFKNIVRRQYINADLQTFLFTIFVCIFLYITLTTVP